MAEKRPLTALDEIESGLVWVNKFGAAASGIQTTVTDVWDRADATPTQQIWLAPTAARLHAIVSTSASDAAGGVGMRTVTVYGLPDWDSSEIQETVTLNGTSSVNTVNSFVIIHRMRAETWGATNVNVGTITATAATDSTVTAAILPGNGQTLMAIYGVPSTETWYVTNYYASINKAQGAAATISFRLSVNPSPDVLTTRYLVKHVIGTQSTGANHFAHQFNPYFALAGPAILKLQGIASAADADATGGFDAIKTRT